MKRLLIIALLITSIFLVSCGDNDNNKTVVLNNTKPNEYTIRKEDYKDTGLDKPTKQESQSSVNNEINVGELKLENTDNSKNYTVQNNSDVVYNGKTFKGLYENANKLIMLYDINTFINLIVKTYDTNESTIYTMYSIQDKNITVEEGSDNNNRSFHEMLSDSNDYIKLYEKYGVEPQWEFSVYTMGFNNAITFYGCEQYILMYGLDGELVINTENYQIQD